MNAVLHYTRQFAQIIPLPKNSPPPDTMEGLGGMQFFRMESVPDGDPWLLSKHYHYCPRGASAAAFKSGV